MNTMGRTNGALFTIAALMMVLVLYVPSGSAAASGRTYRVHGQVIAVNITQKSASGVLASLRGSTLRSTPRIFGTLKGLFRSPRSIGRANGHTKCGWYLFASSLAAALLDGLSEQPVGHSTTVSDLRHGDVSGVVS
ncbi:MAG: hypothetical protein E8D41_02925 [Nitrospira sp.]|nr:MAG: hypothetical protein E8D41_02925 [Nitrospira sp.]